MATDTRDVALKVDEKILELLPLGGKVIETASLGLSDYCDTVRIGVRKPDGTVERFFEKRAKGPEGQQLVRAHWFSESSLYEFIPEFVPKPIGWGTYNSNPNVHFFLLDYVDMIDDDLPRAEHYMAPLSALHLRSAGKSPGGKFGFPTVTRFAHLPQDNGWDSSWESWWTRHMKMALEREVAIHGPHTDSDTEVVQFYVDRVLPRYLKPLESEGRSVQPTLVHTDLWPGNIKYQLDNETVCIYDANALWAHSEMELGLFRNPRYPLGRTFLKRYWKDVPISQPEQDADSRNIMYLVRHQVCLASVYPDLKLRKVFLDTIRLLVDRVKVEESETASTAAAVAQTEEDADAVLQKSAAGTTYEVAGVTSESKYSIEG